MSFTNINIISLSEIDSTNEEAKREIDRGHTIPFVITAEIQTGGRGRFQRRWQSPLNSGLYASWCFKENEHSLTSLLSAYACVKALSRLNIVVQIKWPNDLIYNNRKLGGILVESYKGFSIIGIGINLVSNMAFPKTAISISEIVNNLGYTDLKLKLIDSISTALVNIFVHAKFNLDEIYKILLPKIGDHISFVKECNTFSGRVIGYDQGFLILEDENQNQHKLASEEISLHNLRLV